MSGVWEDREYISRYASRTTGLVIHRNGVPVDADGSVLVDLIDSHTLEPIWSSRTTTHVAVGTYEVTLTPSDTANPGLFDLRWPFTLTSVPTEARTFIEIGDISPAYDALDPEMRTLVDRVWMRFDDIADSPLGGPHAQTYFQSHFSRNRVAQLLQVAVNRLNTVAQPHQTLTIADPGRFPVAQWGGLLEQALYVEVVKHLIRTYVEMPDWAGLGLTHAERRDYMTRWQSVLDMENQDLERALEVFKIAMMGLGRPHVLISGGVYGNYGPTRLTGSVAARPRYWARFY